MKSQFEIEINELEKLSKQGESYSDGKGRYGWRNPVRKDTGTLLTGFVAATKPHKILEIGTGHGLSTLYLALGFSNLGFGSDFIDTIEFDEPVSKSTTDRMDRLQAPVKVHLGDAMEILPNLQVQEPYGMVFFDAQKNQYYPQLMTMIMLGLVGSGTVILADNVSDRRNECLDFLNWFLENNINHHIIETECGLLVARL
ncbi:MAG: O-methyltransferase [Bacteroidota bacterium]|jgi:predicted O-methyltransferase YrrM